MNNYIIMERAGNLRPIWRVQFGQVNETKSNRMMSEDRYIQGDREIISENDDSVLKIQYNKSEGVQCVQSISL